MTQATPSVFLPYQQALMAAIYAHPVVVVEKSRRTGYSWAVAAVAAMMAGAARGQDVFYMGYNLEMAREFIGYCGDWARTLAIGAQPVAEYLFQDPEKPDKDIKAFRVQFASGHKIVALPSVARALRGMQGLVILDEAAFHDDLHELLKAAFALLIWGGKVVVISTHDGEGNPFNALVNDIRAGRKPYLLLRCTFDDALADGLYKRICFKAGQEWSAEKEADWRREIIAFYGDGADEELFCVPSKGSGIWLSSALIEARMEPGVPVLRWEMPADFAEQPASQRESLAMDWCRANLDGPVAALDSRLASFLGEDFGRSGDLTVLWPLQVLADLRRRTPFVVELRNIPFEQQRQVLFHLVDGLPRFQGCKMDATGNGAWLAEVAMQRYGAGRIDQVKLSVDWYREAMPPLKAAFEDGTVTLPRDADILQDLRMVVLVNGVAQIPQGRARGKDGKGRHGDSAVALAMAYTASRNPAAPIEYRSSGDIRAGAAIASDYVGQGQGQGQRTYGMADYLGGGF